MALKTLLDSLTECDHVDPGALCGSQFAVALDRGLWVLPAQVRNELHRQAVLFW